MRKTTPVSSNAGAGQMDCPYCGEGISSKAKRCRHCGCGLRVNVILETLASERAKYQLVRVLLNDHKQLHSFTYPQLAKKLEHLPVTLVAGVDYGKACALVAALSSDECVVRIATENIEFGEHAAKTAVGSDLAEVSPVEHLKILGSGALVGALFVLSCLLGSHYFGILKIIRPGGGPVTYDPVLTPSTTAIANTITPSQEPQQQIVAKALAPEVSEVSLPQAASCSGSSCVSTMDSPYPKTCEKKLPGDTEAAVAQLVEIRDDDPSQGQEIREIAEISYADEPKQYGEQEITSVLRRLEEEYQLANGELKQQINAYNEEIGRKQAEYKSVVDNHRKLVLLGEIERMKAEITRTIDASLQTTVQYNQENIQFLEDSLAKAKDEKVRQLVAQKIAAFQAQLEMAKQVIGKYQ